VFEQLRKGVSKVVKKITITDFSQKSILKATKELQDILIRNEVAVSTAETIRRRLAEKLSQTEHARFTGSKNIILTSLKEVILEILTPLEPIDILAEIEKSKGKKTPYIIAFFGVNGVGKTLSIAKLGKLFKDNGFSCVFAAGDTYRAGSIQQLQKHGDNLKIKVIAQTYGSDSAAVAYDAINHAVAKGIDVVLIDTAGRIETSPNLMSELQKICSVTEPDLKVFVGDALTGNALISQVTLFNEKIGIDCSILNKIDADVKGGAAISVTHISQKPILYIGTGQKYEDLEPFIAKTIVDNIVPEK